jgi:hypothetical protein
LKQLRSRIGPARVAILAGAAALAGLAALSPTLATGAYGPPEPPTVASAPSAANTVFIKDVKGSLRFVAPKTIVAGESLEVLNQTNPKQVGPHTFSLVTKGSLPKTPKARQLCFTKNHICKAIAIWHGVKGNGPVTKNPATAGAEGWDTLGSASRKGDSWFTGNKPGTSFTQQVTADTSAGPTTIYFLCAIHSFMQGRITVLPPGS